MEIVAIKRLSYGGKVRLPGDRFNARNKDAKLFHALKMAVYAPTIYYPEVEYEFVELASENAEVEAEEVAAPIEQPRVKRAYNRRDMTAER